MLNSTHMEKSGRGIIGRNVALPAQGADCDGRVVDDGKVIAQGSVDVTCSVKTRW